MTFPGYEGLRVFYGDLHGHCNVGYGYGSVEEAYQNARLQLDFASVTAHSQWPDMPEGDGRLADVVAFHQKGFRRAAELWPHLQEVTESVNEEGRFVSFLSCEWHSMQHGDHNVYFKAGRGKMVRAPDLEGMRAELRRLAQQGMQCFLIPHHIGYLTGYRGINWEDFTPEFTPVVEIISMHGLAESNDAPYPYLHATGPRDGRSTMQHGLRTGKVFGVIGSTDHHSAHPGSYGHGRVAVWARELTRDGIWEAIAAGRTYALTGDRILLAFSVNGRPMGSVLPPTPERAIEVSVVGGGAIDYVEVLHNNCVIHRWSAHQCKVPEASKPVKVLIELGWGKKNLNFDWNLDLRLIDGKLLSVEPRFRGPDIITPFQADRGGHVFSKWEQVGDGQVRFATRTWGNPNTVTPATQGLCLEILGGEGTRIAGQINGHDLQIGLADLAHGSRVGYLGGYRTPAYCFHRAVSKAEYTCSISMMHRGEGRERDWYYVRVCQKNGQWAWSSPIWVEGP